MYLSCLFYYIIRSCDMRQRWDFLKKILPQCAGQDSSLQILLVCRFKGLSFSVRFELRRPALLLLMCSKGLPFSVRFEQYVLEQVEAASSKGLPFSVRFEPIDNQTGIKYICNPSRVSNCAYLFSLVFFKEKFPRSPILFSIRPVHVANFSGISPRYRNFL